MACIVPSCFFRPDQHITGKNIMIQFFSFGDQTQAFASLYRDAVQNDNDQQISHLLKLASQRLRKDNSQPIPATNTLDFFLITFSDTSFATNHQERLTVAFLLERVMKKRPSQTPLPSLLQDKGLDFCAKTLVSLALFYPQMERRTRLAAAPKPSFYRAHAINILRNLSVPGYQALAKHHQAWEHEIFETFV